MKNPIAAFLEWYRSLALGQRRYFAQTYFVLTTQTTDDILLPQESFHVRFEHLVVKKDFPVRIVSRMVVIRAIIDFVFINKDQLVRDIPGAPSITNIAEKQWEAGLNSWKTLRSVELSDRYINLWLKSELMVENEFDK